MCAGSIQIMRINRKCFAKIGVFFLVLLFRSEISVAKINAKWRLETFIDLSEHE